MIVAFSIVCKMTSNKEDSEQQAKILYRVQGFSDQRIVPFNEEEIVTSSKHG